MLEELTQFAEQHFKEIIICGFGGLALAFVIVLFFKGVHRGWKLPFVRYKPKKR